jgi:hypothetical protein
MPLGRTFRTTAAVVLALLAAACGDGEPSLNRTSPTAVFDAAMVALSRSDLGGLWPLLTPGGKVRVENDLRALQASLRDETTGADVLAAMRKTRPDLPVDVFERARTGTLADVWVYYLLAKPRSPTPRKSGLRTDPRTGTMTIDYEDSTGTLRGVVLRKDDRNGEWRIEHLPL